MNNEITKLLQGVKDGSISVDDALLKIKKQPFEDIGFAKIDLHRKARQGAAEVIYGKGKTAAQIIQIVKTMQAAGQNTILITRLDQEKAIEIQKELSFDFKKEAGIGIVGKLPEPDAEPVIFLLPKKRP